MKERPSLCILMFSLTVKEARVMRQALILSRDFDVTVMGFGGDPFRGENGVRFVPLTHDPRPGLLQKIRRRLMRYAGNLGWLWQGFDLMCYRRHPYWVEAEDALQQTEYDIIIAHDPVTLPIAAAAKRKFPRTRVIADLHEYSPREQDDTLLWRLTGGLLARRLLRRWGGAADGAVTVNPVFCDLYEKECGLVRPEVTYNAPMPPDDPLPKVEDGKIHLIHHGVCARSRHPHLMAEAMRHTGDHLVMHFMFGSAEEDCLAELQALAAGLPPGRVVFDAGVNYRDIVRTISRYHAGIFLLPANTFNHTHALANKLFDFLCAGLPVVVSPAPAQCGLVRENGVGWVTDDFTAESLAEVLNQLTLEALAGKQTAVEAFRRRVNAETEQAKLKAMIVRLLEQRK